MTLLRVANLVKRFTPEGPAAVDGLSFEVLRGEVLALVGPSGCGKTTTLRMIAGLESPDSGTIELDDRMVDGPGVHLPPEKRKVGLVFQEMALFPHLDVASNVGFGLRGVGRAERKRRVAEVLSLVGMAGYERRRVQELSGGQQQRVALARSMGPAPRLILLDEPFANLDPALREGMREEVRGLLAAGGMSALLVTHDHEEALSFADRIGVMFDGKIHQCGSPAMVYHRPDDARVARFLGRTNLIAAEASGVHAETPFGPMCLDRSATGKVLLSVRPEHLRLAHPRPGEPAGEVLRRDFKGHDLTYRVRFGEQVYTIQTDYTCPFQPGDAVSIIHAEPAVVVERK